jgi:hypothetical protein
VSEISQSSLRERGLVQNFFVRHTSAIFLAAGDIGYLSELIGGRGVQFRHTPANYNYSWHRAPQRQFIVNLDADVEIEVSSGERRIIPKGDIFFVEDTTGIVWRTRVQPALYKNFGKVWWPQYTKVVILKCGKKTLYIVSLRNHGLKPVIV